MPPITSHQDRPPVPEPIHMESACVWNRPGRYAMNVSRALLMVPVVSRGGDSRNHPGIRTEVGDLRRFCGVPI